MRRRSGEARSAASMKVAMTVAILLALGPTSPVWAHVAGGSQAGLTSGLMHPISGLDHVAAMLAVGLWGAQLGAPAIWVLPVAFPMVMALGGLLGLMGLPLPGVEVGIALSGVILGLAVATERRVPLGLAISAVSVFAVFHGHAHGSELPEGENGLLYSVGFVVSTGLLHAAGIGVGTVHRWTSGRWVLRTAGAVICVIGGWFLWSAL